MTVFLGLGAHSRAGAGDLDRAVAVALEASRLTPAYVGAVATLDRRAAVIGPWAAGRGWPLVTFTASELAGVGTPNPSAVVAARAGVPSVAEAAALRAAGPGAALVLAKTVVGGVTVAVSSRTPPGAHR
ncbi:cobalamin biosynthesis protein [Couchioplanes caeruleus]|uniref:cobalamin biosynthesis protein n=1 Tax=Couchioplanes caeruleus TaxID=56438 RepID=UPI0020BFD819|nr:cobalamin biosynthesis protein [Couchioplanes caeruleus]UQU68058.1 cobalamin biosynthesis protein [Couchioplanes caeruleus]